MTTTRIYTILATVGVSAFAMGCDGTNSLSPHAGDATELASGTVSTSDYVPNHQAQLIGGQNGITDTTTTYTADQSLGTPDAVARMHGVQKYQYANLGVLLSDLGVTVATSKTATAPGTIYTAGASALGAPVYSSRTPEMEIPSTASMAKQFDIFMAAAPQIVANISKSTRCPGVTLVTNNALAEAGISCLMGKPATGDYVQIANDIVAGATNTTTGIEIAVATILAAANVSE